MTLKKLFHSNSALYPTDKDTHHNYLQTYEDLFRKWKDEDMNILEVGVSHGGSLRLFEDYFTKANIIGYDIVAPSMEFKRAKLVIKDFYSINTDELPTLHIAIDDGPHSIESQVKFVQMVYPKMVEGGIIVVEDVVSNQTSHFDALGMPYAMVEFRPMIGKDDDRMLIWRK